MISIVETEPHLEAALSDARFRHDAPDARLAWQAFRDFTRVRVTRRPECPDCGAE